MSDAVKLAMNERGMSVRKTAEAAKISTNSVHRLRTGVGSIDKALEVLDELGYEVEMSLRPKEQ